MNARKLLGLFLGAALLLALRGSIERDISPQGLPDAVYPLQIPLYPGAVLREVSGGSLSNELFGPPRKESRTWFLTVGDPADAVIAFYDDALIDAARASTDGKTSFEFTPIGAEEEETITITIRGSELQITEVVRSGRRSR